MFDPPMRKCGMCNQLFRPKRRGQYICTYQCGRKRYSRQNEVDIATWEGHNSNSGRGDCGRAGGSPSGGSAGAEN